MTCQPRLRNPSQANVFVGFIHLLSADALRKAGDLNSVLIAINVEIALHGNLQFLQIRAALNFFAVCVLCSPRYSPPPLRQHCPK